MLFALGICAEEKAAGRNRTAWDADFVVLYASVLDYWHRRRPTVFLEISWDGPKGFHEAPGSIQTHFYRANSNYETQSWWSYSFFHFFFITNDMTGSL